MDVDLLLVPYDSGRRSKRLGAGPEALIEAGLREQLAERGHHVRCTVIEPPPGNWRAEIRTAFELAAALATAVRTTRSAGRFPLVLAGNCSTALGVTAALGQGTRVVWCDAHADLHTPETTISGFLDGMALAAVTGRCWSAMAEQIPGFAPVAESKVWLLGARDIESAELEALERSAIRRLSASEVDAEVASRIARERPAGETLYLHLDLDVLDPADGRVNDYAAAGGIPAEALAALCAGFRLHSPPSAMTLSAYDPKVDTDGRAAGVALSAIVALLGDAITR